MIRRRIRDSILTRSTCFRLRIVQKRQKTSVTTRRIFSKWIRSCLWSRLWTRLDNLCCLAMSSRLRCGSDYRSRASWIALIESSHFIRLAIRNSSTRSDEDSIVSGTSQSHLRTRWPATWWIRWEFHCWKILALQVSWVPHARSCLRLSGSLVRRPLATPRAFNVKGSKIGKMM